VNGYRKVIVGPVRCTRVVFRHPRRLGVDEMRGFFGCEVAFGGDENAIYFNRADLQRPISTADSKLIGFLRNIGEETLARHTANMPPLQERLERALLPMLSSGRVSQEAAARELGMSGRTLSRRLAETGQSFRGILDGLREALATRYLLQSDLSQTEITFLLGFADQSSFVTAYRRWTGLTPGEIRRRRDAGQPAASALPPPTSRKR
jgi:AraC-like DNA-binding protein